MGEIGWVAATPAIAVAVALLLGPGLIVLAPLRMGVIARTALAGAVSVVVIGVAGMAFSPLGIRFAAWQVLLIAAMAGVVVWLLRRRAVALPAPDARAWPSILTWLAASTVIAIVAFAAVPSPDLVSQTYDNVFHTSAIAAILRDGDASSLTLRTLIETDRPFAFYPAAWHSLVAMTVQITGSSIPVAANGAWIGVATAVWLPGATWLAQVCLPRHRPTTVALLALPLGAAFGAMPYALLAWGTLYPTFLATALLPVAVAVPLLAWRGWHAARADRRMRVLWWGLTGTAVALGAVALGQPRVLATWALLLAVPFIGAALRAIRTGWRRGGGARRRVRAALLAGGAAVVLLAAGGAAFAVFRLGLFERPLDDRLGGPQAQAIQPLPHGVWQVLAQSWLTGVGSVAAAPAVLLAAAVIWGAVAAWRGRSLRWLVASYALVALLFVLAAGSDDVVTKLATALWYKDKYRLSSALPVLGVTLATLGILSAAGWLFKARPPARRAFAVSVAWVVTVASAVSMILTGTSAAVGSVFRLPASSAGFEVVSRDQIAFFEQLSVAVPAGQRVLGDPWDGSAWTLAFGGREPVFPHVNGQWDADRMTLAWHLADIQTNPEVCAALDRLRVRFVVYSPHAFGGGDPAGNHFPGPHAAIDSGLFTLVADDGDTRLYRIDECGPLT